MRRALAAGFMAALMTGLSAPAALAADTTAPVVTVAPDATLGGGPVGSAAAPRIPIVLRWMTDDQGGSGICSTQLQRSADGGPWTDLAVYRRWVRVAPFTPDRTWRVRVRVVDCAANTSAWSTSRPFTLTIVDDTDSRLSYDPAWVSVSSDSAIGGSTHEDRATTLHHPMTFNGFTGRGIGALAAPPYGPGLFIADGNTNDFVGFGGDGVTTEGTILSSWFSWPVNGWHRVRITNYTKWPDTPAPALDGFVILH